jgi:CheY-like chemotaxis protein
MPQMDGWGALKELKADAELRDIPVIMVTILNERGMAIPLGDPREGGLSRHIGPVGRYTARPLHKSEQHRDPGSRR